MSKVLYIKADAKGKGQSRTTLISESFIKSYKESHPEDEIITLDLYKEDIEFLNQEDVNAHSGISSNMDSKALKYAHQFLEADKYVFSEPLWNLGVPAILKAYFDYVCVSGLTFEYTAQGPIGLCKDKKAINITTRGCAYSEGPFAKMEMCDNYIRTIMTFLGVCDYTTIVAEALDYVGQDVDSLVNDAIKKAQALAKDF